MKDLDRAMKKRREHNKFGKNRTWFDLARHFFGPCTDDEADSLLWCCTAYPAAGPWHCAKQLREISKKSGGNVGMAMEIADRELEEAMASREV